MSVNEAMLMILMKNFGTKSGRVLALEKYVQRYGALSQDAWVKIKPLLDEVEK